MIRRAVAVGSVVVTLLVLGGCGGAGAGGNDAGDTPGLVAYYPFNGNANDASGNGNNPDPSGIINVAPATDRNGNANSAYRFDGSSRIEVPSSSSLESPTDEGTIAAWIRAESLATSGSDFDPILIKSDGTTDEFMYQFFVRSTGIRTQFNEFQTGDNIVGNAFTFNNDQWYHVATTWIGTSVNHYVGGTLVGTGTTDSQPASNSNPLVIGADPPGLTEYFNGDLDEIRIYNRALSAAEIQLLYESE